MDRTVFGSCGPSSYAFAASHQSLAAAVRLEDAREDRETGGPCQSTAAVGAGSLAWVRRHWSEVEIAAQRRTSLRLIPAFNQRAVRFADGILVRTGPASSPQFTMICVGPSSGSRPPWVEIFNGAFAFART